MSIIITPPKLNWCLICNCVYAIGYTLIANTLPTWEQSIIETMADVSLPCCYSQNIDSEQHVTTDEFLPIDTYTRR